MVMTAAEAMLLKYSLIFSIVSIFIILIMVFFMILAGRWFSFGVKVKTKTRKGWGIVAIDEPDGVTQTWHFADFKKPYFQLPKENAAFVFDHSKDKRIQKTTFAFFDRFLAMQKDKGKKIVEVAEIKKENKSAWEKLMFWRKNKEPAEDEPCYYVQQKEESAVNQFPSISNAKDKMPSNILDSILLNEKLIAMKKLGNTGQIATFALIALLIVIVCIDLYVDWKNGGAIKALASFLSEKLTVIKL